MADTVTVMAEVRHVNRTMVYAGMTDAELDRQLSDFSYDLACCNRWGDPTRHFDEEIEAIEYVQRQRRLSYLRAGREHLIVDDPGVRPTFTELRPITGLAKARAEWKPSRPSIIAAVALAFSLLLTAGAMGGQRLVEIEASIAARQV